MRLRAIRVVVHEIRYFSMDISQELLWFGNHHIALRIVLKIVYEQSHAPTGVCPSLLGVLKACICLSCLCDKPTTLVVSIHHDAYFLLYSSMMMIVLQQCVHSTWVGTMVPSYQTSCCSTCCSCCTDRLRRRKE